MPPVLPEVFLWVESGMVHSDFTIRKRDLYNSKENGKICTKSGWKAKRAVKAAE